MDNKTSSPVEKMPKIALFVGSDIIAHMILNKIVPAILESGLEPVIFFPKPKATNKAGLPELREYAFYERKILDEAIYPYLDANPFNAADTYLEFKPPFVTPTQLKKEFDKKYKFGAMDIKIEAVEDINDPAFVARFQDNTDFIGGISVRCFQIFYPPLINALSRFNENGQKINPDDSNGFLLNLHPGMLPEYRGVYSTLWAMAHGEENFGCTLHAINTYSSKTDAKNNIDTGRIIDSSAKKIPVVNGVLPTLYSTNLGLVNMASRMIISALKKIHDGETLRGYPQANDKGAYYSYPSSTDLASFRNQGISLVDPAEVLEIFTEAFSKSGTAHAAGLALAFNRSAQAFNSSPSNTNVPPVRSKQQPKTGRILGRRRLGGGSVPTTLRRA